MWTILQRFIVEGKILYSLSVRSVHFAHTRMNKYALNQALYTSYKTIVSDTQVKKVIWKKHLKWTRSKISI